MRLLPWRKRSPSQDNATESNSQPDFWEAAQHGDLARVQQLLRTDPRLLNAPKHGRTALYLAAFAGHYQVCAYLLQEGARDEAAPAACLTKACRKLFEQYEARDAQLRMFHSDNLRQQESLDRLSTLSLDMILDHDSSQDSLLQSPTNTTKASVQPKQLQSARHIESKPSNVSRITAKHESGSSVRSAKKKAAPSKKNVTKAVANTTKGVDASPLDTLDAIIHPNASSKPTLPITSWDDSEVGPPKQTACKITVVAPSQTPSSTVVAHQGFGTKDRSMDTRATLQELDRKIEQELARNNASVLSTKKCVQPKPTTKPVLRETKSVINTSKPTPKRTSPSRTTPSSQTTTNPPPTTKPQPRVPRKNLSMTNTLPSIDESNAENDVYEEEGFELPLERIPLQTKTKKKKRMRRFWFGKRKTAKAPPVPPVSPPPLPIRVTAVIPPPRQPSRVVQISNLQDVVLPQETYSEDYDDDDEDYDDDDDDDSILSSSSDDESGISSDDDDDDDNNDPFLDELAKGVHDLMTRKGSFSTLQQEWKLLFHRS